MSNGNTAVLDQRAHQRIQFTVEVSLNSEHNFYTGFTSDISEGGVFVATNFVRPVGSTVEFDMALGKGKLRVTGEVRWVREPNEFSDAPPGMGVCFKNLSPAVRDTINKFISRKRESIFYDDEF